ncbi:predicted protein [Naegleria gruberi]|uniref:Predicted protein n=1 Tax=Naegleria gruberi TaxID=5762 RepID=D2VEP4_NAEGR|nr:uncharacterized protein NAEGRDRAFT_67345 [Naegleria gruberi]EFC44541.1 predicted protein [Naegleria gruberi]|eukprot:XP_002677285.1 predicted protein [Naegleria gruberi strain NEG-M]
MIGSSEGYLRIYDVQQDKIIREERFHDLEIVKIRSQSVFHNTLLPNFQKEIILIIYPNHVITIDPLHLKKELNSENPSMDLDDLEYKKWNLQEFAKLNDACCLYSHCSDSSIFEVMEEKSEFDIVAVGKSTLALYSTANEIVEYVRKRTRVKKIATQVASKVYSLASNYSSWLWGGNKEVEQPSEPEEPEILPGTRIPISNRFIDEKREIFHADLDYTGKYLATSDSLGRILIFDLSTMTVMKVFKGYREAHCYWFFTGSEPENMNSESNIELLLIFAPRRGILECWTIDGRRLYALTVGTDKRFIKASGNFIEGKETTFHPSQFYLISQTDGSIQQVEFDISLEKIQKSDFIDNSSSSGSANPFKLLMENKLN